MRTKSEKINDAIFLAGMALVFSILVPAALAYAIAYANIGVRDIIFWLLFWRLSVWFGARVVTFYKDTKKV